MSEELSDKVLTETIADPKKSTPPSGPMVSGFFYGGMVGLGAYATMGPIAYWLDGYYNKHLDPLCCTVYSALGTLITSHAFGLPCAAAFSVGGGGIGAAIQMYRHFKPNVSSKKP